MQQTINTQRSIILWGECEEIPTKAEDLSSKIKSLNNSLDFVLVPFQIKNWNDEFSPWKAKAVFGKNDFGGEGKKTLLSLENFVKDKIKHQYSESKIFIAGYSLAGLFSLWSLYESDIFDGAVCCSSSLWFENWLKYAENHNIRKKSSIYMSLGKQEEKTKNPIMSKVGENTKRQYELLQKDLNVSKSILEWNEGNHFTDSIGRLAKGICWILEDFLN